MTSSNIFVLSAYLKSYLFLFIYAYVCHSKDLSVAEIVRVQSIYCQSVSLCNTQIDCRCIDNRWTVHVLSDGLSMYSQVDCPSIVRWTVHLLSDGLSMYCQMDCPCIVRWTVSQAVCLYVYLSTYLSVRLSVGYRGSYPSILQRGRHPLITKRVLVRFHP